MHLFCYRYYIYQGKQGDDTAQREIGVLGFGFAPPPVVCNACEYPRILRVDTHGLCPLESCNCTAPLYV
jgi:hypothetical protein